MSDFEPLPGKDDNELATIQDIKQLAAATNQRVEHLAEALYCTGQIAFIHHRTVIRMLRLLRELDKETRWVDKHPKLYERLESIREVAAQAMEEYNDRLSAVEEAIQ